MSNYDPLSDSSPFLTESWRSSLPAIGEDGTYTVDVLPLRDMVIFPGMATPLLVGRTGSLAVVAEAMRQGSALLAVAQRDPERDDPASGDLFKVGCIVTLSQVLRLPDDTVSAMAHGHRRAEIVSARRTKGIVRARVRLVEQSDNHDNDAARALQRATLSLFEQCVQLNRNLPEEAMVFALNSREPGRLADFIATVLDVDRKSLQQLLENFDPMARLQHISAILGQELNLLELEDEIHTQVHQELDRGQREMYLREQLRAIQTELGEGDIWSREAAQLRQQIATIGLPDAVAERALQELDRLQQMPPLAPETGIIRSYVEWLLALPWQQTTQDNLDLTHAEQVLEATHHGVPKAKERILEYLAVRSLAADKMRQPILCFVGPPGTGKTSLGKSIAAALGREFVRLSLGGVHDEAEIRGHRRTYIGALPGRILQTMRRAGTINPVFMLDEIDKLASDHRGDPASAMLEVLDPEQNNAFSDHYIEIPYDLSKVLFITTANWLGPVPEALEDRMEVIEFSGYVDTEKIAIARKFLIPKQRHENGLPDDAVKFTTPALQRIIVEYTYEAGVRNLDKQIAQVCRKLARRKAEGKTLPQRIGAGQLVHYLGSPQFAEMDAEKEDSVGVVTSLSWTWAGGDASPIEAMLIEGGSGRQQLTGSLGTVLQESFHAGYSYLRKHAKSLNVSAESLEKSDIHVHMPEGGVRKDGPSAGIALATAVISAFTGAKVRHDVAMTGEVTLRGHVLPIGGVKEKLLAAYRKGLRTVVLPRKNEKDMQDVPEEVKKALKLHFVSSLDEVLQLALVPPPRPVADVANGRKSKKPAKKRPKKRRVQRKKT